MNSQNEQTLKEITTHGTRSFPCALYETKSLISGQLVKHHWHEEIEILHSCKGDLELEINMEKCHIPEDSFCFINSGELHQISSETPFEETAVVFDPHMLSFDTYDLVQEMIIQPIIHKKLSFPRVLLPSDPLFSCIKNEYEEITKAYGDNHLNGNRSVQILAGHYVSELFIKAALLKILACLARSNRFSASESSTDHRIEAIKTSLTYILEHYMDKIYIRDLAVLVNMNEQYYCRFFKKYIGKTPIVYLNEYRIKKAIELLTKTDKPVTEISLECGFNNLGNFLKEFRRNTGTTPLQYQKFHVKKSK